MRDLTGVFDRTGAVARPPYRRLWGELWSLPSYHPAPPPPQPAGDRTVLVIPAFLTSDAFTRPLRDFLARCGHAAVPWGQGINWGPTAAARDGLRRRLDELHGVSGALVDLVGISMGGLLARDLAQDRPDRVRRVVTIGSPVRLPTASPLEPLIRLCARHYPEDLDPERLSRPLPLPTTAIYSRDDGVVAWQSCWVPEPLGQVVAVDGAHVTMCRNPQVLQALAHALA
ncbi:alpha/beta fold hydrolase [Nitrospirillum iridis]|uniref:Pimeloyl-ACP methyl ester carboxylesterase n=1 Tax=Nitrospirillum iridis TaxID=765888 RepID=A0A7X0B065_9PROT|nr:alpha/beta fold hydrolase [Nitrospirillum iridis]MBB6251754.1 pimeloyl-ACP methyl ester carboxylesterase [Nitrospirillum iridis]